MRNDVLLVDVSDDLVAQVWVTVAGGGKVGRPDYGLAERAPGAARRARRPRGSGAVETRSCAGPGPPAPGAAASLTPQAAPISFVGSSRGSPFDDLRMCLTDGLLRER